MVVDGVTSVQVRWLVSTETPAGGVPAPVKLGVPWSAWLPLTATAIGAGVTVVKPPTYVMV